MSPKAPDHRPKYPVALAVGAELRFKTIARVTSPCIQRFGPGMIVRVDPQSFPPPLQEDEGEVLESTQPLKEGEG